MIGEFNVSNDGIAGAFDLIAQAVQNYDAPETVAHRLSIVLDELAANMIRHDDSLTPDQQFSVQVVRQCNLIVMKLSDPGQAFNPFGYSHDQVPEIGGQGIKLIKGLCSSVEYDRKDGRNEVTVTINAIG